MSDFVENENLECTHGISIVIAFCSMKICGQCYKHISSPNLVFGKYNNATEHPVFDLEFQWTLLGHPILNDLLMYFTGENDEFKIACNI